jgi:hypothetical protein
MTPEQEFAKRHAEERAARNYELGKCFECNGYAYCVTRDGAVITCSRCKGTGKQINSIQRSTK